MGERNFLVILPTCIKFEGFSDFTEKITFCFYESGVAISPIELDKRDYYYTIDIVNHISYDIYLINKLKSKRLFGDREEFVKTSDSYIEKNPHKNVSHGTI